jgi:hypothetical protein
MWGVINVAGNVNMTPSVNDSNLQLATLNPFNLWLKLQLQIWNAHEQYEKVSLK